MKAASDLERLVEAEVDRLEGARQQRPLTDEEHSDVVYCIAALGRLQDGRPVPQRIIDRLPLPIRSRFPEDGDGEAAVRHAELEFAEQFPDAANPRLLALALAGSRLAAREADHAFLSEAGGQREEPSTTVPTWVTLLPM